MNNEIVKLVEEAIRDKLGLDVTVELYNDPIDSIKISPSGEHPNESFLILLKIEWRSAEATLIPGTFSAPLIAQMGRIKSDDIGPFSAYAAALEKRHTRLTFRANGLDISPYDSSDWPSNWRRVELKARSSPQIIEPNNFGTIQQLIMDLVVPVFGMTISLIGVDEQEMQYNGAQEGKASLSIVTRYERKKVNREACIQLKGTKCAVCGFDFRDVYGPIGAGYIEIHHVVPVSKIGADYRLNVITDLEPLCANCHAMIHRMEPPFSIGILIGIIAESKKKKREIHAQD